MNIEVIGVSAGRNFHTIATALLVYNRQCFMSLIAFLLSVKLTFSRRFFFRKLQAMNNA